MSPLSISPSFLLLLLVLISISPAATSLNCTIANKPFDNCGDLPTLGSRLHWSYDASNSSLSVAFVSSPSKPDGWISWGINPTATGMAGTQSLVAYKAKNGSVVVKTYDLVSYHNISQSKLSFEVWDLAAQVVAGEMAIFATVKVPENAESVNQVWQVGPSVGPDGSPAKHDFEKANLDSKSTLALSSTAGAPAGSPAGAPADAPTTGSGSNSTGSGSNSTGSSTNSKNGGAGRGGAGVVVSTAAIVVVGLLMI